MSSDPVPVGPRRKPIFLVHDDEIEVVRRCGPFCRHSEGQEQDVDPFDPALCEADIPQQHRVLWRSIHRQVARHQQADPSGNGIGGGDQRAVGDVDVAPDHGMAPVPERGAHGGVAG